MKKHLLFVAAALFLAGMTISCNNNAAEEAIDSVADTTATEVVEENTEYTAECTEESTTVAADDPAMLAAAKEAAQAKCNCYKTDPASVESCIKSILSAKYAQYQGNDAFTKAMEAEYKQCIKEKAAAAAKEVGNKAVKEAAKGISNAINNKK